MVLTLLPSLALSAPTFTGLPADVAVADRAWRAAEACTGRPGRAAPVVPLVRRTVALDYLGIARTDPAGLLWRVELTDDPDRQREVLVHEVTHAWVSDGPVALVEGAAELLADCVVARDPGLAPLQFDDGRDLTGLPDLLRWQKPGDDSPTELHAVRTDAYVGTARLLRTAAEVVAPAGWWSGERLSWERFEAELRGAGQRGAELADALDGGARAQAEALADRDRDGRTALQERWAGTDDARFDTDGDGWWDGAVFPEGARVVPLDGTPICGTPTATGGEPRGAALPSVLADGTPGGVALVRLSDAPSAASTGAWWVTLASSADPRCADDDRVTVFTDDPRLAPLVPAVRAEARRALAVAEQRFGAGPGRVVVALGGDRTGVQGELVRLQADAGTDPAVLAGLAVAASRSGGGDWAAVEVIGRSLVDRR